MKKAVFMILFLLFSVWTCAVNPVTGKREISLISESQEIALGKQTDGEIRAQYGTYDDPALQNYVQSIGKDLAPYTHRPHLGYQFAVLDTPVINAFAVPGGYVYVTRGMLALMGSEAEMAVALGHELGHVNARHSVRRLSEMMLVQAGLAVGSALSQTFADISGLASVGVQLLFLKYSRDDERQADALGVDYARKGKYNPAEMISFFAALQKMGDLSGGQALPGFLSTHPLTSERIQNVKAMLAPADSALQVRNSLYLRRIEGMVYGEDPRQGFVEGQVFYHPDMAFSFSIPKEWKVQNTPSQVALISPDEKAVLLLQAEKSTENLADYARKKGASIKGSQFIGEERLVVPGLSSHHQLYEVPQQDQPTLRLRLSAIRKGAYIYTFSALTARSDFSSYNRDFQASARSFAELRDASKLGRKPLRLALAEADGKRSLQEIFSQAQLPKEMWPAIAILNRMELAAKPAAGQLVKITR